MPKFRKKPVVIEAMEFETRGDLYAVAKAIQLWARLCEPPGSVGVVTPSHGMTRLEIDTLEGSMTAQAGDWIIRGVKGEFYPCKPDVFAATYEPVEAPVNV